MPSLRALMQNSTSSKAASGKLPSNSRATSSRLMLKLQVQPYSMLPSGKLRPFRVPKTSWYNPAGRALVFRPSYKHGLQFGFNWLTWLLADLPLSSLLYSCALWELNHPIWCFKLLKDTKVLQMHITVQKADYGLDAGVCQTDLQWKIYLQGYLASL